MNTRKEKPVLYLAGALHSASHRQFLELVASLLDDHYRVFVPHRDAGLFLDRCREDTSRNIYDVARDVAADDRRALDAAAVMLVVCVKHFIADPGVCVEMGYACAIGVPVVAYAPDLDVSQRLNPMVHASITSVFRDLKSVVENLTGPGKFAFTKKEIQQ